MLCIHPSIHPSCEFPSISTQRDRVICILRYYNPMVIISFDWVATFFSTYFMVAVNNAALVVVAAAVCHSFYCCCCCCCSHHRHHRVFHSIPIENQCKSSNLNLLIRSNIESNIIRTQIQHCFGQNTHRSISSCIISEHMHILMMKLYLFSKFFFSLFIGKQFIE